MLMLETFGCGHWRIPENIAGNGNPRGACRTCKNASERRRASTPAEREKARIRMAKWKGVEPGRSRGVYNASKTHCAKGHEYTEQNTYVFNGTRQCITCRKARTSAYFNRKRANGGNHTIEQWETLCRDANYRCVYCRLDRPLTRDHIIPVSKGGTNDIGNIQPLCRQCNASKKDRLVPYEGGQ